VTKRAGEISPFFRIANVKDQLHAIRIAKAHRIDTKEYSPVSEVVRTAVPDGHGYNIFGASGRRRVRGEDCVHLSKLLHQIPSMNSFLPEPADTGRHG
jgi:hypothetical protein